MIWKYNNLVNVRVLHKELSNAGFKGRSITYDPAGLPDKYGNIDPKVKLIIELDAEDDQDPSSIIQSHVYTIDKTINWQKEYSRSATTDDKLLVLSKHMKLIDTTDLELQNGRILDL